MDTVLSNLKPYLSLFNWIDVLCIVLIIYFLLDGLRSGFTHIMSSILAYVGSIWLAVKYHTMAGEFLVSKFGLGQTWKNALGYLVIAIFSQVVFSFILSFVLHKLLRKLTGSPIDNILGAILSILNTVIIMTFFFIILLALPLRGTIRQDIRSSVVARFLVDLGTRYGGPVKSTLDEITQHTVKFLTVHPTSSESLNLDFSTLPQDLTDDYETERQMIEKINDERIMVGKVPLTKDDKLSEVARSYSRKMILEGFFSHFDKEGNDIGVRLMKANLSYQKYGENLAYAPDLAIAHKGLMDSEGHRKNILDPVFSRVGVGVVDAGIYGKMFTQVFTDNLSYFQNQ